MREKTKRKVFASRDAFIALAKSVAMRPYLYSLKSRCRSKAGKQGGELVSFNCNICGNDNESPREAVAGREEISCFHCGSTLRFRSIVRALSLALFDEEMVLVDFPERPDIQGLGMTDYWIYAIPLSRKFSYLNTYYHKQPRLDITRIESFPENSLDFLISSDVFEHVPPPVSRAFENVLRMLKPGGKLVFTVPITNEIHTQEHFPELFDYELRKEHGRYRLFNKTSSGEHQVFDDLCFHGGHGSTLEMRRFARKSLEELLAGAGFRGIRFIEDDDPFHGILWDWDLSVPIIAEKP